MKQIKLHVKTVIKIYITLCTHFQPAFKSAVFTIISAFSLLPRQLLERMCGTGLDVLLLLFDYIDNDLNELNVNT